MTRWNQIQSYLCHRGRLESKSTHSSSTLGCKHSRTNLEAMLNARMEYVTSHVTPLDVALVVVRSVILSNLQNTFDNRQVAMSKWVLSSFSESIV